MNDLKITAVIIAKNEEKKIAACLESVAFCDEIILIDSGSTDTTKEIAKKQNAKVYTYEVEDFSALRNFGSQKATGTWLLYIDADERVTKELEHEIKTELQSAIHDAYTLPRKNYYFHKHEWPTIEQLERLFKKSSLQEWYGVLHESPRITGTIGALKHPLLHYSHDDLTSMIAKTNKWSEFEARNRFKANHPSMSWWRFPRVMMSAFWQSYVTQKGYKVGTVGLIESLFQAFSMFITYAKLWELQQKKVEVNKSNQNT